MKKIFKHALSMMHFNNESEFWDKNGGAGATFVVGGPAGKTVQTISLADIGVHTLYGAREKNEKEIFWGILQSAATKAGMGKIGTTLERQAEAGGKFLVGEMGAYGLAVNSSKSNWEISKLIPHETAPAIRKRVALLDGETGNTTQISIKPGTSPYAKETTYPKTEGGKLTPAEYGSVSNQNNKLSQHVMPGDVKIEPSVGSYDLYKLRAKWGCQKDTLLLSLVLMLRAWSL